jgi:hypothetical protein
VQRKEKKSREVIPKSETFIWLMQGEVGSTYVGHQHGEADAILSTPYGQRTTCALFNSFS